MSRAPGAPEIFPGRTQGIHGAISALLFRLENNLAADLRLLEVENGLDAGALDAWAPKSYFPAERSRLEANEFPAIIGMGDDTGNVAVEQIGPTGDLTFEWQYNIRLYGYVRGDTAEAVSAARYGLALAVRRCVLRWPNLAPNAKAEPARWREVFLNVDPNSVFRYTSGFYLLGAVNATEIIATPPLGTADTVEAEVTGLTG